MFWWIIQCHSTLDAKFVQRIIRFYKSLSCASDGFITNVYVFLVNYSCLKNDFCMCKCDNTLKLQRKYDLS